MGRARPPSTDRRIAAGSPPPRPPVAPLRPTGGGRAGGNPAARGRPVSPPEAREERCWRRFLRAAARRPIARRGRPRVAGMPPSEGGGGGDPGGTRAQAILLAAVGLLLASRSRCLAAARTFRRRALAAFPTSTRGARVTAESVHVLKTGKRLGRLQRPTHCRGGARACWTEPHLRSGHGRIRAPAPRAAGCRRHAAALAREPIFGRSSSAEPREELLACENRGAADGGARDGRADHELRKQNGQPEPYRWRRGPPRYRPVAAWLRLPGTGKRSAGAAVTTGLNLAAPTPTYHHRGGAETIVPNWCATPCGGSLGGRSGVWFA